MNSGIKSCRKKACWKNKEHVKQQNVDGSHQIATPTKASKQQHTGVTRGRQWEAMTMKWSEKPLEKESQKQGTHIYNNLYIIKTIPPSYELFTQC
jgi:hypothetical protein